MVISRYWQIIAVAVAFFEESPTGEKYLFMIDD